MYDYDSDLDYDFDKKDIEEQEAHDNDITICKLVENHYYDYKSQNGICLSGEACKMANCKLFHEICEDTDKCTKTNCKNFHGFCRFNDKCTKNSKCNLFHGQCYFLHDNVNHKCTKPECSYLHINLINYNDSNLPNFIISHMLCTEVKSKLPRRIITSNKECLHFKDKKCLKGYKCHFKHGLCTFNTKCTNNGCFYDHDASNDNNKSASSSSRDTSVENDNKKSVPYSRAPYSNDNNKSTPYSRDNNKSASHDNKKSAPYSNDNKKSALSTSSDESSLEEQIRILKLKLEVQNLEKQLLSQQQKPL